MPCWKSKSKSYDTRSEGKQKSSSNYKGSREVKKESKRINGEIKSEFYIAIFLLFNCIVL